MAAELENPTHQHSSDEGKLQAVIVNGVTLYFAAPGFLSFDEGRIVIGVGEDNPFGRSEVCLTSAQLQSVAPFILRYVKTGDMMPDGAARRMINGPVVEVV